MSRFDSFFEAPQDPKLKNKILEKAAAELVINKQSFKRRRFIARLAPSFAALAASLVFIKFNYFGTENTADGLADMNDLEDVETVNRLVRETDDLDLVEELSLLENLDDLELIEDESLEG